MARRPRTRRPNTKPSEVEETVVELVDGLQLANIGRDVRQAVTNNPFTSILIAFGIGWLWGKFR